MAGLFATGWDHILTGTATLGGDSLSASPSFRLQYSLVMPAAAGILEEATLRGIMQLRTERYVGSMPSQLLAGLLFIVAHGQQMLEIRHLLFLTLLASVTGWIAGRSRAAWPASLLHGAVNFLIATVVLACRT